MATATDQQHYDQQLRQPSVNPSTQPTLPGLAWPILTGELEQSDRDIYPKSSIFFLLFQDKLLF